MKHEEEGGVRSSWEPNTLKARHMHLLNEHERVRPGMALWTKLRCLRASRDEGWGREEGGYLSKGIL